MMLQKKIFHAYCGYLHKLMKLNGSDQIWQYAYNIYIEINIAIYAKHTNEK